MIRESTLTDEDIKAAANAKLAALEAEAQDKACDTVWGRTMTVTSSTSAAMAVTAPLGAMAGPLGIVAWLACAVGIGAAGIAYSKREGEAIYEGDKEALDRWLSDKDYEEFMARATKVRTLANAAIERPEPTVALPPLAHEEKPVPPRIVPVEIEIEDGWQPADLPQPFIPYLASQIHILIAATTGSGKTWVLRNLCTHIANRGDLLCIADPKGTQWGELAPASKFMQTGEDYLRLFDHLNVELNRRRLLLSQGHPVGKHLWIVLDEWFLVQSEAKGMESPDRMAMENLLVKLIAAGRELNLHLIMVGQSHLLGDLSLSPGKNTFSSGLRDSICVLALGCKETKDNAGEPMAGSAKTIEGVLTDQYLIKNKGDRDAAQAHHAALRRQPDVNRTYVIHGSRLYVGQTPDLTIPDLVELAPFPKVEA
jgi:hypothetical protein